MTNKLVDIEAECKIERELSYLLYDGDKTEWVAKSLVENNKDGTWTMPEWLALDKGFI